MARAKRTDRADARRRYRQTTAVDADVADRDDVDNGTPTAARRAASTTARPVGFTGAIRMAYRRPDYRADLAALPELLRSRAFLIPLAVVVLSSGALAVAPKSPWSAFAYQFLGIPPAFIPLFVAGYFAPRASYLIGLILSVVDVALAAILMVTGALFPSATKDVGAVFVNIIVLALPFALFGAPLAAWYRRFLRLSAGSRQRRPAPKPGSKAGRPARG